MSPHQKNSHEWSGELGLDQQEGTKVPYEQATWPRTDEEARTDGWRAGHLETPALTLQHNIHRYPLSLTAGGNVSIHLLQVRVPSLIVMETLSIIDQH